MSTLAPPPAGVIAARSSNGARCVRYSSTGYRCRGRPADPRRPEPATGMCRKWVIPSASEPAGASQDRRLAGTLSCSAARTGARFWILTGRRRARARQLCAARVGHAIAAVPPIRDVDGHRHKATRTRPASFLAESTGRAAVRRGSGMMADVRLLILGGTWFVGRAAAEAAVAAGWQVTCFNRGRTGRDVDGVASIRGDREVAAAAGRGPRDPRRAGRFDSSCLFGAGGPGDP
jgi:hypothetical protein